MSRYSPQPDHDPLLAAMHEVRGRLKAEAEGRLPVLERVVVISLLQYLTERISDRADQLNGIRRR